MLREFDSHRKLPMALAKRTNALTCSTILDMYAPEKGCLVVDLTYGYGGFHRVIDRKYEVVSCDVRREQLKGNGGFICSSFHYLPFRPRIVDVLLYDPPYSSPHSAEEYKNLRWNMYNKRSIVYDVKATQRPGDIVTAEQLRDFARVLRKDGVLVFKDVHEHRHLPFFEFRDLIVQDLGKIVPSGGRKFVRNYAFWNVYKKEG